MSSATGLSVLFALPRSRSTAFFRAMATKAELTCIHEPFCTLSDTGSVDLPDGKGGTITLSSLQTLADHICRLAQTTKVFVKETTDSDLTGLVATDFLAKEVTVAFLVREPGAAIASHLKMRSEAGVTDFGFVYLQRLMEAMQGAGHTINLYQSEDLAENPSQCLKDFCCNAGLDFSEEMLHWEPEDRQEWQRTRDWHSAVAQSSGFHKTSKPATAPQALIDTVLHDYHAILSLGGVPVVAEGGCHCGALRYALWETPQDLTICHCSICQSTTGAPHLGWGTISKSAFQLSGTATKYKSSEGCMRQFCPSCGTQLSFSESSRPDQVDFTIASLDNAEHYKPVTALHTDFRLAWDEVATGCQAFPNHRNEEPLRQYKKSL